MERDHVKREREKERVLSILIFSARLAGIPGWVYGSVNVDTSPRILHLESGIRGWRGKSLLPANLARNLGQQEKRVCIRIKWICEIFNGIVTFVSTFSLFYTPSLTLSLSVFLPVSVFQIAIRHY